MHERRLAAKHRAGIALQVGGILYVFTIICTPAPIRHPATEQEFYASIARHGVLGALPVNRSSFTVVASDDS